MTANSEPDGYKMFFFLGLQKNKDNLVGRYDFSLEIEKFWERNSKSCCDQSREFFGNAQIGFDCHASFQMLNPIFELFVLGHQLGKFLGWVLNHSVFEIRNLLVQKIDLFFKIFHRALMIFVPFAGHCHLKVDRILIVIQPCSISQRERLFRPEKLSPDDVI